MMLRKQAARGRFWLCAAVAASALMLAACQTQEAPTQTGDAAVTATAGASHDLAPTQVAAVSPPGVHPGEAIYKQYCGACHDQPEATRSPAKDTLKAMSFQVLNFALTEGKMKTQGAALNAEQRAQVISYLIGRDTSNQNAWTQAMMCPDNRRGYKAGAATVAGFGFGHTNTRSMTASQASLSRAQMSNMELAWSMAFPDATTMRSQPAIVGDTMYLPVADAGAMYAIDLSNTGSPCLKWVYTAPGDAPLRTSASYGVTADGTPLLVFGGLDSTVHAVDARTGKAVWTKSVAAYSHTITTGTPVVLRDRVIVPVSQFEIMAAADNNHECCTNQGHILSLDPKTGAEQWRYNTLPPAAPIRDRGDGKMLLGPSGAPIWNSPAVDEKRGLIFFGTGESNSPPAHANTNAIIAIGLKDGKQKWSHQATPRDIYNAGCGLNPAADRLNCVGSDETVYRDVDFGASMILGKLSNGAEYVFAGQKSGSAWALNPDTGAVVWRRAIGTGGALGGVHWGIAYDRDLVFVPISSVGRPIAGEWDGTPAYKSGLYALDAATGEVKWSFTPTPDCTSVPEAQRRICGRGTAFSAAPTVIGDVVVAASLSGVVHILDRATGEELWSTGTAGDFQTVNGVPGKGGAVDAGSMVAGNGLLLVQSGYGMFGQAPGNVLLAYKPKPKR